MLHEEEQWFVEEGLEVQFVAVVGLANAYLDEDMWPYLTGIGETWMSRQRDRMLRKELSLRAKIFNYPFKNE